MELLVVMAIIALLGSMLLVFIGKGRAAARTVASTANLKEIHILFRGYLDQNRGRYPSARMEHLPPPTRHWRRVLWENAYGPFEGDPPTVMEAMQTSDYSRIFWCPLMVGRYGQDQHPWGRGSYALNNFFMDPAWGGAPRKEGGDGLYGLEEPYVMAGTLHPADKRFGTYTHIESANFPYDTAWSNLAYEYGGSGNLALALYLDGHAQTLSREAGMALDSNLRDFRTLE